MSKSKEAGADVVRVRETLAAALKTGNLFSRTRHGLHEIVLEFDTLEAMQDARGALVSIRDAAAEAIPAPAACDCGFSTEACASNPCLRKQTHLAGMTPGSKWPNTGQSAPADDTAVAWRWRTRPEDNWTFSVSRLSLNDIGRTSPTFEERPLYTHPAKVVDVEALADELMQAITPFLTTTTNA